MKKLYVLKMNEVVNAIKEGKSFRASNLIAMVDGNNYLIYSHATLIAKAEKWCEWYKLTYFDNTYYSVTTSKYQRLILQGFYLAGESVKERRVYTASDFE